METKNEIRTDFLFPKRDFFTGFSSVFNLAGDAEFNTSNSAAEADKKALTSDWENVGEDIRRAIKSILNEQ